MMDTASRLANRVQLTTDGLMAYLEAVEQAFAGDVDYAQLIKPYGPDPNAAAEHRYTPPEGSRAETNVMTGNPNRANISTAYVEHQNLNIRTGNHRYTCPTNTFSRKIENLAHSVSLYFLFYNFCR